MGERWFGGYRLEWLLGSGGTGEVWLAYHARSDRLVALKILGRELTADDRYRRRFEREARLAAGLRGPHVVPIHAYGDNGGRLFIEMEYIEGADVAQLLRRDGPMRPATAVDIVAQVASALDDAHAAGMLHRDVKPSNIVVDADGCAYLIDFGVAQRIGGTAITGIGQVVGTLSYMAPERFTGKGDRRCDIYSLACVLFECLTGQRPFGDSDPAQQLHDHLKTPPPLASSLRPALPFALDEVLARGMAKRPGERYSSAGEFARAASSALRPGAEPPESATRATTPIVPVSAAELEAVPAAAWQETTRSERSAREAAMAETDVSPSVATPAGRSARGRFGLAAAVTAVLISVVAAVWLRTGADGAGPASLPATAAPPGAGTTVTVTVLVPMPPVPALPRTVPAVGLPCDPSLDRIGFAPDGTRLTCPNDGKPASWAPAAGEQPGRDALDGSANGPSGADSGNGANSGSGGNGNGGNGGNGRDNAGHGNGGSGQDKPDKKSK